MTQLNEQFRRMQVLAGIITEEQLNEEVQILNEGFDDFNLVGWTTRIKEIAKEMNYQVAFATVPKIGEQYASEAAKEGKRKAFIYSSEGENMIVASFSIDQNEKDKNKQFIQKKLVDTYKSSANVEIAEETYGDTVMTVIIKEK